MRDLKLEYIKCASDPVYFIENYLQTFDQTRNGYVPFTLFERQKDVIRGYRTHNNNLVLKYRQSGISTLTAAYAVWLMIFADRNSPEKILIIANKRDLAVNLLKKIKEFLDYVPTWIYDQDAQPLEKDSEQHIVLPYNKSEAKAVATSAGALRGFTPTFLIIDEAAHVEQGAEFWGATQAALATGGKSTLISTPKGMDEIFYRTYQNSEIGENDFYVHKLQWWEDPRYNKELKWVSKEKDNEIVNEYNPEKWNELIASGYTATSPWFELMCRKFNNDKRMIAQELLCDFLSSGGTVIDNDTIHEITLGIKEPIFKEFNEELWYWELPKPGHRYAISVDPARGDGEDNSVIEVLDFDTMEQVAQYYGKMAPDTLAEIAVMLGSKYNQAYAIVDITGLGASTSLKMYDIGYRNFHWDIRDKTKLSAGSVDYYKTEGKVPGFTVGTVRVLIVEALERNLRLRTFKVNSKRTTAEMKTFIYKNGKADHAKGAHDDSLMALAMGLYVLENHFKEIEKNRELTKRLLENWSLGGDKFDKPKQGTNNQYIPLSGPVRTPQTINKEHFWLFK